MCQVVDLVLMVSGAAILSFAIQTSPIMLWVGTVTLGLGMSSIFPTAISWADIYYPLTGRAAAVFITGSGIGEMVIPVVTGFLFENVDKMWLMYIVFSFSVLVGVVFIALQCVASRNPLPRSTSKLGFVPLENEQDDDEGLRLGLTSLDADADLELEDIPGTRNGYQESMRRRQGQAKDALKEETTMLVDISD